MNTGSSTQGTLPLRRGLHRYLGCLTALGIESAEIDQERIGAGDKGPISSAKASLTAPRHGEQDVGGEILRHRVGDAVHAAGRGAAVRAEPPRRAGPPTVVARCCSGIVHLISLRRHDPDQVRWVGLNRLSVRRQPDTPRDCCEIPSPRGRSRQAVAPCMEPVFAGLQLKLAGGGAMTPFFVQIKCELGKAYQVANELAEAEIASEIYSTAGDYDLLVNSTSMRAPISATSSTRRCRPCPASRTPTPSSPSRPSWLNFFFFFFFKKKKKKNHL